MNGVPVPAAGQLPVQAPALPVRSKQPGVCSTQPRRRCSPAGLLLQLLLWKPLHLEQRLPLQLAGLEINIIYTFYWRYGDLFSKYNTVISLIN